MAKHEIITWRGGTDMGCACGANLSKPCDQIVQVAREAGVSTAGLLKGPHTHLS